MTRTLRTGQSVLCFLGAVGFAAVAPHEPHPFVEYWCLGGFFILAFVYAIMAWRNE